MSDFTAQTRLLRSYPVLLQPYNDIAYRRIPGDVLDDLARPGRRPLV